MSFKIYCAVYVFFARQGKVYLMRRANTGYRDGMYSLPAGHVEDGESLVQAALREVQEETGLSLSASHLQVKHAMYRRCPDRTYADYFFVSTELPAEPQITEPHKCDAAIWASEDVLPAETVPEVQQAWQHILQNQPFSEIQL